MEKNKNFKLAFARSLSVSPRGLSPFTLTDQEWHMHGSIADIFRCYRNSFIMHMWAGLQAALAFTLDYMHWLQVEPLFLCERRRHLHPYQCMQFSMCPSIAFLFEVMTFLCLNYYQLSLFYWNDLSGTRTLWLKHATAYFLHLTETINCWSANSASYIPFDKEHYIVTSSFSTGKHVKNIKRNSMRRLT